MSQLTQRTNPSVIKINRWAASSMRRPATLAMAPTAEAIAPHGATARMIFSALAATSSSIPSGR